MNITAISNNSEIVKSEWLYHVLGAYLTFTGILGIFGNCTGLFVFWKCNHLRSPVSVFIIGLLCTDLGMCVFGIPLSAASNFAGYWLWGFQMCIFQGFIVYFCGLSSMYILTAISLNRYIIIKSLKITTLRHSSTIKSLTLCYCFGLFWSVAPFTGWTRYEFESIGTACAVAYESTDIRILSFNIAIFLCCFLVPVVIMMYCYYQILRRIITTNKNSSWKPNGQRIKKRLKQEKRLAKTFLIMIGAFLISWTPYAVVAFWRAFGIGELPIMVSAFPAVIAKSSAVWNPFIYALLTPQFKEELIKMIPCACVKDKIFKRKQNQDGAEPHYELCQQNNHRKSSTEEDKNVCSSAISLNKII